MTISRSKRTRVPEEATKALRNARKGEGRSTVDATVSFFVSFLENTLRFPISFVASIVRSAPVGKGVPQRR